VVTGLLPQARAFVVAVAFAGAAAIAAQATDAARWGLPQWASCLALACAVAVFAQFPLAFRRGGETQNFSITDSLFPAALMLTEPAVVVLGVAAGSLAGQLRKGWAPYKVVFNASQHVIGMALAGVVFAWFGNVEATDPWTWAAAFCAMAVYFAVNATMVSGIVAVAQGRPWGNVLLPTLGLGAANFLVNVAVGILAAIVWAANPLALPLLAVPVVASYWVYRQWVRSLRQHERIQDIARTAETISLEDLSRRIPAAADDEVAVLTSTFNHMLDRLKSTHDRERRFLAETSHELRTPITICRGHLDILGTDPSPGDVRETVALVLDELGRMSRIVDDMTLLGRLERGEELEFEEISLWRFLEDVAVKASRLLDGRLKLGVVAPEAVVKIDRQRLTQAVLNLLHNAAVHDRGGQPVELRASEWPDGWRLEVCDQGGGMPPSEEKLLFSPFWRGGRSTGSGLGLAVVRAVAEAHGGSSGVANEPGVGATFWIRVPK